VKKSKVETALSKVVSDINSIIPIEYFNIKNWYFAGGCLYSIWNDREIKDYDLFCRNVNAIKKLRKWFRQNKDKSEIITKNAISMDKYQFVVKYVGDPEVEVAKFDFLHNMFYFDGISIHNVTDWDHIESNKLEFNSDRARDVLNILTRIPKFINRGMDISQKEILDIIEMGTRPTKIIRERRSIKKIRSGKGIY